ncbi:MAG: SDR family NAD(P)-dependent oxidoreductase [Acidimicrobiia bacterium]
MSRPHPIDLDGAAALITGAGSGIGKACALALSRRGTSIVVADIDASRSVAVADEITAEGGRSIPLWCDVTSLGDLQSARDRCLEEFGRVDIVMNNVGVLSVGPAESIPIEEWQRAIDINIMGVVRANAVFLPIFMEQRRGHIINTASMAGLLPYGYDRLPYVATKHAIVGMSESLALYLAPHGVNVSCLCPAGVATNIVEQMTFFGGATTVVQTPPLPMVTADVVGDLVVDAIVSQRFMILTAPEARADVIALATDPDAYLLEYSSAEQAKRSRSKG